MSSIRSRDCPPFRLSDAVRRRGIHQRCHLSSAALLVAALALGGCGGPEQTGAREAKPAPRVLVSGVMSTHMDPEVRPNDDFYRYVNGRWLKETSIPPDRSRYGAFEELADRSEEQQRLIIEEAAAKDSGAKSRAERQVGDLFRSFMDTKRIDSLGASPIRPYLEQIDAIATRDQLATYMAKAYRYGVEGPAVFFVNVDLKSPTEYIVHITQSGLGLPDRDYYFREDPQAVDIRREYFSFISHVLDLAGFADTDGLTRRIIATETRIAEGQWTRVENRDREKTYNRLSVAQLDTLMASFDWQRYLGAVDLGEVQYVVVRQPTYLEKLDALYRDIGLDDWKLYLKWQVINTHLAYLSQPFDAANFDFYSKTLRGTVEQRERWKRAVSFVNRSIGELVGQVYVARYFKPEAKRRMEELVRNLTEAFREAIDELDWMSGATKKEAQKKLAKFTDKIGYPNKWRDYSALRIDPDDLMGNVARVNAFEMDYEIRKLGKPIDREEWHMTPQTVNAYYNSALNEIVFPAAILQPPFFNAEADDAANYGAIGTVIGHEMSHGFDDQGRKTDGDGALRDWWTNEDAAAFKERTDKLVSQYDGYYPLPHMHINGQLTLGENIGDLSGLSLAYRAYQISREGKEPPVLDGFTGAQRFFIGFAQVFREKLRDEAVATRIQTDPHAPGQYRVLGVVTNVPAFYEAFAVKEGDGLYRPPEQRVKIW